MSQIKIRRFSTKVNKSNEQSGQFDVHFFFSIFHYPLNHSFIWECDCMILFLFFLVTATVVPLLFAEYFSLASSAHNNKYIFVANLLILPYIYFGLRAECTHFLVFLQFSILFLHFIQFHPFISVHISWILLIDCIFMCFWVELPFSMLRAVSITCKRFFSFSFSVSSFHETTWSIEIIPSRWQSSRIINQLMHLFATRNSRINVSIIIFYCYPCTENRND